MHSFSVATAPERVVFGSGTRSPAGALMTVTLVRLRSPYTGPSAAMPTRGR